MKAPIPSIPWDLTVFLSITIAGFGISVKRLMVQPGGIPSSSTQTAIAFEELPQFTQELFDLSCLESRGALTRLYTSESRMRLKGRFCNGTAKDIFPGDIKIRNLTTGFESQAFVQNPSRAFLTKEIELVSGKNIVELEWLDKELLASRVLRTEIYEK